MTATGSAMALVERGTIPCIPPTKNHEQALDYDKTLYRQRHKIENMFAKLKDWRRIATRYDRCAHTFFSAICIAAAVGFYLKECPSIPAHNRKSCSDYAPDFCTKKPRFLS
jgi:hypothetical protein